MASAVEIKKNTTLFRGSGKPDENVTKGFMYFTWGPTGRQNANNLYTKYEGNKVHTYKTSKPLMLLDMSNPDTIKYLRQSTTNQSIIRSLQKSFALAPNNMSVLRYSKLHHDVAVSKFICTLGYDGYVAPTMKLRKYGDTFHPEIVLCMPRNKVVHTQSEKPNKPLSMNPQKVYAGRSESRITRPLFNLSAY